METTLEEKRVLCQFFSGQWERIEDAKPNEGEVYFARSVGTGFSDYITWKGREWHREFGGPEITHVKRLTFQFK